jgi:hypothetical protein
MEKLCCFCKHMDTESESWGSDSMGDFTEFYILCQRGHFRGNTSIVLIRENILRAETCPDYEPHK